MLNEQETKRVVMPHNAELPCSDMLSEELPRSKLRADCLLASNSSRCPGTTADTHQPAGLGDRWCAALQIPPAAGVALPCCPVHHRSLPSKIQVDEQLEIFLD